MINIDDQIDTYVNDIQTILDFTKIYKLSILMWSDCSYAMLLFVQSKYQGSTTYTIYIYFLGRIKVRYHHRIKE